MRLGYVASRYDGDGIYKETRRPCSLQVKVEQKSRRRSNPDQVEMNLLPAIGTAELKNQAFYFATIYFVVIKPPPNW